jgi:hypothetical protein
VEGDNRRRVLDLGKDRPKGLQSHIRGEVLNAGPTEVENTCDPLPE